MVVRACANPATSSLTVRRLVKMVDGGKALIRLSLAKRPNS